jgi:hypothetical protein
MLAWAGCQGPGAAVTDVVIDPPAGVAHDVNRSRLASVDPSSLPPPAPPAVEPEKPMGHPGDWSFNIGGRVDSAPALYSASFTSRSCNDRLFVATHKPGGPNVYGFDNLYPTDGSGAPCLNVADARCSPSPSGHCPRLVWQQTVGEGPRLSGLAVDGRGNRLYVASNDGIFGVLATVDGKIEGLHNARVVESDVTANYGYCSPWLQPFGDAYIAVSLASDTRSRLYRFGNTANQKAAFGFGAAVATTPILWGGFIYLATFGAVRKIQDGATLTEITGGGWPASLGAGTREVYNAPSIDVSRNLLFVSSNDDLHQVNLGTGQVTSQSVGFLATGTNPSSSSMFVDPVERFVYKGHEGFGWRWRYDTNRWINDWWFVFMRGNDASEASDPYSSPLVFQLGATKYAYIGDGGGYLNRYNTANAARSTFPSGSTGIGARIDTPIVVDYIGGNIYFGGNNGRVYQIDQSTLQ